MSEDLNGRQTLPACDGWPAGYFYRMKEAAIMAEVDPKLLEMAEVFHIPKKGGIINRPHRKPRRVIIIAMAKGWNTNTPRVC